MRTEIKIFFGVIKVFLIEGQAGYLHMELSTDTKNILGLQLPTDPRWVDLAAISIEAILTDHAYCEQKAALTCISYIQRYSDRVELVKELAPIVTEEWGHFRLVLQELHKRGLQLGKQRKDLYVNALIAFQKKRRRRTYTPTRSIAYDGTCRSQKLRKV